MQLPGALVQRTLSIGIAELPLDSETFWQTVRCADVAMYNAKEVGRNRVLRFRPTTWKDEVKY